MKETQNYGLRLPEGHDPFDIGDFNQNTLLFDRVMHEFQGLVDEMSDEMAEILEESGQVDEHIERLSELLEEAQELVANSVRTVNGKGGNHVTLDYADVGAVPMERMVNGHPLTEDVVLGQRDIDLSEMEESVSEAQDTADKAKIAAGDAQGAADVAQGTANTARTEAGAAQSTADTARSEVAVAQSTANNAMPKAGGSFTGLVTAGGTQAAGDAQVRNIQASTTDLTAGSSPLPTGQLYLYYE